jgi:hypothetical protein
MKFVTRKFSKEFWEMIILWNKESNDNRINSMYNSLEQWEQIVFDYHKEWKHNAINKRK